MSRTLGAAALAAVMSVALLAQSPKPAFDSADVHAASVIGLGDGLTGGFDFTLSWTPRGAFDSPGGARPAEPPTASGVASDPNGSLTAFEALERELGLRVQKGTHAIPVTVVDHLEEKPTDN